MIRITCTNCRNVLSIDDAFAGGVCRCQHCGTIQTVPAHLKGSAEKATAEAALTGNGVSKTLYKNEARAGSGSGSGLDDLANLVASSGGSGLTETPAIKKKRKASSGPEKKNQTMILLAAAGAIILLLIIVVIVLLFKNKTASPADNSASQSNVNTTPGEIANDGAPPAPVVTAVAGPAFGDVKLSENVVVYVIDNGSSSSELLDYIKGAVFHSIESLGPDRRFQILFWNPDSAAYPSNTDTAFAIKDNIEEAKKKLEDTMANGKTDPNEALKRAIASNPGEIVLITAKGDDLDDSLLDDVMNIRGSSTARIHTIALVGAPTDGVLAKIAAKTGGTYTIVPEAELKALAY